MEKRKRNISKWSLKDWSPKDPLPSQLSWLFYEIRYVAVFQYRIPIDLTLKNSDII